MNCHKCKTPGVKNQVLGKEFYYCRTCKDEIKEHAMTYEEALGFVNNNSTPSIAPLSSWLPKINTDLAGIKVGDWLVALIDGPLGYKLIQKDSLCVVTKVIDSQFYEISGSVFPIYNEDMDGNALFRLV